MDNGLQTTKLSELPEAITLNESDYSLIVQNGTSKKIKGLLLKGNAGDNGKSIEIQKTNTHIQWRQEGGQWINLVALADLKGDKGEQGEGANVDLTDYATKVWVTQQLASYYTKAEIDLSLSNKANISHAHTEYASIDHAHNYNDLTNKPTIPSKTSDLTNDSGFLTSIPSEYVTEEEMSTALSTKANKSDIPSLEGYATETFVTNKIAEASLSGSEVDLSGYATKDDLTSKVDKAEGKSLSTNDLTNELKSNYDEAYLHSQSTHVQSSDIPTKVSDLQNDSDFVTQSEMQNALSGKGLTTEQAQQLQTAYEHSQSDHVSMDEVNQAISNAQLGEGEVDLTGYATETYVDNAIDTALDGHTFKFLTQAEYDAIETKDPLVEYHITDITDTGEGITTEQAQQLQIAYEHSQTVHVQASDIPSLDGYATETYVDNTINVSITEEKNQINNAINSINEQLDTIETNKLNKDDKIKSSQLAIDSNANKIKLINLSDEVQQALTGNAPALSVIPNKSITLEKIGFVTTGKNLFNKATATFGKMLDYKSTTLKDTTDYYVSDYIEVDSSTQYTLNKTYGFAYYDSSKTGISGHLPADFGGSTGGILTITTPSNAKYIRFNIYKTLIDVTQFEKGSSATNYENYYAYINRQYVERQPFLVDEIPNGSVGIDKLNFIKFTKNMFDKSKVSDVGWYMAYNNGIPTSNEYLKTVCYSDFIQVEKGEKYIVNQLHSYCYFDSSKKYISGEYTKNEPYVLEIPVDCKYVVLNLQHPNIDKIQFEKGEECTEYESYGYNLIGMVDKIEEKKEFLNLPEKYELVVGDTFELFYKGIILANNPYNYNIKITCSKGSAYSKRYIFIPSSSDIGIHTMTINIINDNEEVLDTKTVNLVVKAKASNPSSVKNVLCVGDSLTVNGVWVSECCRRLTGSSGNPVGEGLSNINFVGTCIGTDNAKFEGYGGWRYEHYNSNKVENQQYWITTTTNKNNTYQKSKWKDSNNIVWIIEEIESNRIKLYRNTNGVQMLPSSGALTWVSGGDGSDNTSIVYTSYTTEAGNPFWNNDTNKVDFLNYATKLGVSSIDYCYVLLGWNSTNDSESVTKDNIRKFINNIRTSYPNCKITLLGLQVPSIDGFGSNYGCSWNYFDKLKFVFNYNKWNLEVSKEFTEVDFINISSQFDSENNIQLGERQINARNSKTEIYGTNGVHPAKEGYLQIADAVYRNLTHKL